MALPAIGAALKAAKAAKKLKNAKKPKKKDTEEMEGALKDFQKMGNAEKAAVASVPATGAALTARKRDNKKLQENNPDKDLEEKALDKRKEFIKQSHMNRFPTGLASGGLARRRRKSDGGLKVGQRKIAKGCGKVMGNRRKKTLYT